MACCSFGVISWDTSAAEMSAAISRSSMTLMVVLLPWRAARATARSAARSASSLVEEGSLRSGADHDELEGLGVHMDSVLVLVG